MPADIDARQTHGFLVDADRIDRPAGDGVVQIEPDDRQRDEQEQAGTGNGPMKPPPSRARTVGSTGYLGVAE